MRTAGAGSVTVVPEPYRFSSPLWEYDGPAAWFFVSLPADIADEIAQRSEGRTNGFGSVRVEVQVGGTRWSTSLFPDKRQRTYVLPVKRSVREAETLTDGQDVDVVLALAG